MNAVRLHKAFLFETTDDPAVTGIVFKVQPGGVEWEARIDDTSIRVRRGYRTDAVEDAINQAKASTP